MAKTQLEVIAEKLRTQEVVINRYSEKNGYGITSKNALSDGDEIGKGQVGDTGTVGSLTDINTRIQVTSKIFDYVKSNNLQNPASRKEIIPDAKLGALLLNGDKTVFFFNIQTFLKRHFPSAASVAAVAPEAVV